MMSKIVYSYSLTFKELLSWITTNKDNLDAYRNKQGLDIGPKFVNSAGFITAINTIFNADNTLSTDEFYSTLLFFEFKADDGWILTKYGKEIITQVFSRYFDMYCVETLDLEDEELDNYVSSIFNRIFMITNNTYDKYSTILQAYEDKKNSLLSAVQSSSTGVVRFNDTPQDEGEFDDDEHTSNITQSSSNVNNDMTTPIERIAQIERSYKTTFLRWSNEFARLFWWED